MAKLLLQRRWARPGATWAVLRASSPGTNHWCEPVGQSPATKRRTGDSAIIVRGCSQSRLVPGGVLQL